MEHTNVLFSIGPLQVTSTVVSMWAIILILALLSYLATRRLKEDVDLGTRVGFGDIAATILDMLGINVDTIDGTSWKEKAMR